MSDGDIRRLCRFFSELTLEDIHSLEIRMFPFLSAVEGMDLLPAVDAVFHRIKAINDEQERLQSMATFYSWLLPRTRRIPWVLYSVHRILSVLDATQIGLTLAQKVRSLDNRAIEGVFDEGSAWCLTILTTQGALSPANYIPRSARLFVLAVVVATHSILLYNAPNVACYLTSAMLPAFSFGWMVDGAENGSAFRIVTFLFFVYS
ncbi:hypothetical protein MRX96_003197 [Rhipicephalus microplus]